MFDRRWTDELVRRLARRMESDEKTAAGCLDAFVDVIAAAFRPSVYEPGGKEIVRKAALQAMTPEARTALSSDLAPVDRFPFRVGRESRCPSSGDDYDMRSRRNGQTPPTNELYLLDLGKKMYVSREHFMINRKAQGGYELVDLGSRLGTVVSGRVLGPNKSENSCLLRDGDVIFVGGSYSPIVFKFVLVEIG